MKNMSKKQKQIVIVAGAAIALLLIYRWYQSRNSSAAATGAAVPATDTAGSDYAALAGQEQGDVASLQSGLSGLSAQEQQDIAGLTSLITGQATDLSGFRAQEQADIGALNASIAGLAIGTTPVDRTNTTSATIQTHPGGPFYKYYLKVTGRRPPATLSTTNTVYEAWKAGKKAVAPKKHPAHHHAGAKNTHVAHPNPGHRQQVGVKDQLGVSDRRQPKHKHPNRPNRPSGRHR